MEIVRKINVVLDWVLLRKFPYFSDIGIFSNLNLCAIGADSYDPGDWKKLKILSANFEKASEPKFLIIYWWIS